MASLPKNPGSQNGRTLFLLGRGAGVRAVGGDDDGCVRVFALSGALVDAHAAPGTS